MAASARARFALELCWVREVTTLGAITPLPGGPQEIAGVVNFQGSVLPVLQLSTLVRGAQWADSPAPRNARSGDAGVVFEADGTRAALAMDLIEAVSTLPDVDATRVAHPRFGTLPLLDPSALLAATRQGVLAAAAANAPATAP